MRVSGADPPHVVAHRVGLARPLCFGSSYRQAVTLRQRLAADDFSRNGVCETAQAFMLVVASV